MSEHVNGAHRDQTILFPDTLDKYVDAENPVRRLHRQPQSREARLQTLNSCRHRKAPGLWDCE